MSMDSPYAIISSLKPYSKETKYAIVTNAKGIAASNRFLEITILRPTSSATTKINAKR